MTDKDAGKLEKNDDSMLKKALELASGELLNDANGNKNDSLPRHDMPQDNSRDSVKSAFESESNWHKALPKGETSVSLEQVKESLKNPALSEQSKSYLQYIEDNFTKVAGIASKNDKASSDRVSLQDMVAVGGMNEILPAKMQSGVKFLHEHFFELSGLDDKITGPRIERLIWDHSFQLYPKETQNLISGLPEVFRGAVICPHNFDSKKAPSLGRDEALALDAASVTDNLRIQALQKAMFAAKTIKLEDNLSNKDAQFQYSTASLRYAELKKKGLDDLLSK